VDVAEQDSNRTQRVDGLTVVTAPDQVDATNADALGEALLAACEISPTVITDMSGTTFCDSSGLRALIQASWQAQANHGELRIATSSERVLRLFTLTGLDKKLNIYGTVTQALAGG
jgi:anti-sigma B factor antagonist